MPVAVRRLMVTVAKDMGTSEDTTVSSGRPKILVASELARIIVLPARTSVEVAGTMARVLLSVLWC